jgi:hypothetical protein
MLAGAAEVLAAVDVALVNLEGTLGLGGVAKCAAHASPTCFSFQAPAANAAALGDASVDIVKTPTTTPTTTGRPGRC